MVNTACNKNGQIQIINVELNGTNFVLINFYNSNSKSEQLSTFSTLLEKVYNINIYIYIYIIHIYIYI